MSHCKYHPLVSASYYCRHCKRFTCDNCSDENVASENDEAKRCFICRQPLSFLGAAYSVEPFWRRLNKIYRYGFKPQALQLIALTTVLTLVAQFIGIFWVYILPLAISLRYSFDCLEKTAEGVMEPPQVVDSLQGGLKLLIQLIGIMILAFALLHFTSAFLGAELAIVMVLLELFLLPAVFILLAIEGSLPEAVNPSNISRLIKATGASYVIMLIFIAIMMSSVVVLDGLIGAGHSNIQIIANSMISGYYQIITFHMMGYLVFQKQDALGFYAADSSVIREPRQELDVRLAHIEVLVKEGLYQDALEIYKEILPKNYNNLSLWEKCFRLMCAVNDKDGLVRYADAYLPRIMSRNEEFATTSTYRTIINVAPDYMPQKPDICIQLAKDLLNQGDPKAAIKLLNNFHKRFNDKSLVFSAYSLLVTALEKVPNLAAKADNYRKFLAKLEADMSAEREQELKDNPLAKFMSR